MLEAPETRRRIAAYPWAGTQTFVEALVEDIVTVAWTECACALIATDRCEDVGARMMKVTVRIRGVRCPGAG